MSAPVQPYQTSRAMKTFIHHDGALGDVLLSLPILREIRKDGALLHFAGREDVGALLRECGLVDEATSAGASRYASLYAGVPDDAMFERLREFERAFLFTVDETSLLASSLRAVIPRTRVIVTIPSKAGRQHVSLFRMRQFGIVAPGTDGHRLAAPRQFREAADAQLRRFGHDGFAPVLAVHPGSGGASKVWPLERFFRVMEQLQDSFGLFVLLLTGPAESGALRDQAGNFSQGRAKTAHLSDADLIAVAALLAGSALFIGNDSGVGHLAASVCCPVLALFGPTDPALWAPRGPRVELIKARSLAEIAVDRVYLQAAAMLREPAAAERAMRKARGNYEFQDRSACSYHQQRG